MERAHICGRLGLTDACRSCDMARNMEKVEATRKSAGKKGHMKQAKATKAADTADYVVIDGVAYPKATTAQVKKLAGTGPSYDVSCKTMRGAKDCYHLAHKLGAKVDGAKPEDFVQGSKWGINVKGKDVTFIRTK